MISSRLAPAYLVKRASGAADGFRRLQYLIGSITPLNIRRLPAGVEGRYWRKADINRHQITWLCYPGVTPPDESTTRPNGHSPMYLTLLVDLVHPTRFERVASAFGGQRSIQLSYRCLLPL